MLFIAIENFILFSTLLAIFCFVVALSARSLSRTRWWNPHPHTFVRLYTATLTLPPIFAAWIVATALLPETWLGESAFDAAHPSPSHEMHLLSELTFSLHPMLTYATGSFAVCAASFAAWSGIRSNIRIGKLIARLEMSGTPPQPAQISLAEQIASRSGIEMGLVMSKYPLAFVGGFWRSKLVLSSGLLHTLTPSELAGVLEHEVAHHTRRDNMVKLLLSITSYASLAFALSRLILKWRSAEVEIVCDEVAAGRTSSPLEIADALVKLKRNLKSTQCESEGILAAGSIADGSRSVARGVHHLVRLADQVPTSSHLSSLSQTQKLEALLVAGIFTITLVGVHIYAPLGVHTAAESIIQFMK